MSPKSDLSHLKIAIVHDWLVGGGAENVVEAIHHLFPKAPIYTAYCSPEWRRRLQPTLVVTSYMQHWPFSKLRKFLPALRQRWFSKLDLSEYDLVISSSGNGEAKGVKVGPNTVHISYCHSPTHFYWRHYRSYLENPGFGIFNPLARFGLRTFVNPLRRWDYEAAQGPDFFIANSKHIQKDIQKYYDRKSVVIHPPVNTKRFKAKVKTREGFVTIGRQVPLKRTDLIVKACNRLNVPLTVIGKGPEHHKLVKMGNSNVTFIANASDEAVAHHLASADAFIFAAYEDFGMTPVEAMASGTPVIAYEAGGALDYIVPEKTGVFFDQQTVGSVIKGMQIFSKTKFNHETIAKSADQFSVEVFNRQLKKVVEMAVKKR